MSQEMKNKQTFGDYSGCSFFILGILTNTSDSSRLGTHSLSAPCFYKAKKKKKDPTKIRFDLSRHQNSDPSLRLKVIACIFST